MQALAVPQILSTKPITYRSNVSNGSVVYLDTDVLFACSLLEICVIRVMLLLVVAFSVNYH